ncbi:hypothetical protein JB92DRAFT_639381 [Gautieria morchelliformis]|nr:hypothetical protein JB92DRAFT_639381 [Gautieria morchelliformis]
MLTCWLALVFYRPSRSVLSHIVCNIMTKNDVRTCLRVRCEACIMRCCAVHSCGPTPGFRSWDFGVMGPVRFLLRQVVDHSAFCETWCAPMTGGTPKSLLHLQPGDRSKPRPFSTNSTLILQTYTAHVPALAGLIYTRHMRMPPAPTIPSAGRDPGDMIRCLCPWEA